MKKLFYAALMTLVMIGLGSCSNKTDLTGTEWEGIQSTDLGLASEEDGEPMTIDVTSTLTFTSPTEGTMTFAMFGESESSPFTYTCDGKGKGVIHSEDEEGVMESNFTIDGDKLTIVEEGETFEFTKKK
ncbi:MAG: hypothetical protein IKS36_01685 [Bacteroidales bacterium]|nr:hypothetical protein [Bacteroidales bacterium]